MKGETYLEDLSVGQIFRAGPVPVEAEELIRFARENDPQYFHVDPEAAKRSMFGGLISSGWRTAALAVRMLNEAARFAGGVVGVSGEIAWLRPVRPGDELSIESEILEIAALRSRADRGVVDVKTTMFNQKGEIVQTLVARMLVFARPARD